MEYACIYNPDFGDDDEHVEEQLVFSFGEPNADSAVKHIGIAQGLVELAYSFAGRPVSWIKTDTQTILVQQLERLGGVFSEDEDVGAGDEAAANSIDDGSPREESQDRPRADAASWRSGFWFVGAVSHSRAVKGVHPEDLLRIVRDTYEQWRLHEGLLADVVGAAEGTESEAGRARVSRWWTPVCENWLGIYEPGALGVRPYLRMAPGTLNPLASEQLAQLRDENGMRSLLVSVHDDSSYVWPDTTLPYATQLALQNWLAECRLCEDIAYSEPSGYVFHLRRPEYASSSYGLKKEDTHEGTPTTPPSRSSTPAGTPQKQDNPQAAAVEGRRDDTLQSKLTHESSLEAPHPGTRPVSSAAETGRAEEDELELALGAAAMEASASGETVTAPLDTESEREGTFKARGWASYMHMPAMPSFSMPSLTMPAVSMPAMPAMPSMPSLPAMPAMPSVSALTSMSMPTVQLPSMPSMRGVGAWALPGGVVADAEAAAAAAAASEPVFLGEGKTVVLPTGPAWVVVFRRPPFLYTMLFDKKTHPQPVAPSKLLRQHLVALARQLEGFSFAFFSPTPFSYLVVDHTRRAVVSTLHRIEPASSIDYLRVHGVISEVAVRAEEADAEGEGSTLPAARARGSVMRTTGNWWVYATQVSPGVDVIFSAKWLRKDASELLGALHRDTKDWLENYRRCYPGGAASAPASAPASARSSVSSLS